TAPPATTGDVVVTGRLDAARDRIAPSLGAVEYTIGPAQIAATPQGEDASFNQVLLRAPGVVLDSFGEEHVRGEHGGLTYRVNGVLLPESLNGFGQELDTRIARSVSLVTGALPAQFGFRTAGIVDVTTKSGGALAGNRVGVHGGSYDTVQPSIQLGGAGGRAEYFASGSYLHDAIGIENPTAGARPLHDGTGQGKLFGYASLRLDADSRVSLLASGGTARFQLPDTPGLAPVFVLAGAGPVASRDVDENQTETNGYLVLSYQRSAGALDLQVSPYVRHGRIGFRADRVRDLVFQGVAADVAESFTTAGVQADLARRIGGTHTLRAGLIAQHTDEHLDTLTFAFPVDAGGGQGATTALAIPDRSGNRAWEAGVYVQDEWRLSGRLTLDYGARYDRFDASFDHEGQFSPRAGVVWTPDAKTTAHLGYARYFAPPSAQFIPPASLARLAGTSAAPEVLADTPTRVERSHYVDAGIRRVLAPGWQVTLDGFYKRARHLGDLGQFGAAVILSPFSYDRGHVEGGEISTTWVHGGWNLFGNFGHVETSATAIDSAEYQFPPGELAYIATHAIRLDHEGEYTVSAGAARAWGRDTLHTDLQYGHGLRSGFANTGKQPSYATIDIGGEHRFGSGSQSPTLRLDVVNLFDHAYPIRDGSGLGISAAQYGQRRGFYAGLTKGF
ncbi:TonB-dependent receptor, partial [Sphingomonas bacterium]|uniref:TonB-dependent receptor n=1 Tax=Sphingomonas bacterium TaxID=1895847 RepID=UPI00157718D0